MTGSPQNKLSVADGRLDEKHLAPELQAYYGDRELMWRNLSWLVVLNAGWGFVFTVVNPLIQLRLNSPQVGMGERTIATLNSVNGYAVSFLVMYFSWKSDHTVSRWGRRIPYLWISAPGIILTVALFPFVTSFWLVLGLVAVQMFFMDWKASTISLLGIDMVPRTVLARTTSILTIAGGLMGFLALRYGMRLSDFSETLPYLIGAGTLLAVSLAGGLMIKEPPIRKPQTESFKPWSTLQVGWRDRRMIIVMLAVPMLNATMTMYGNWIWLFAKNVLHLARSDMGTSLSWAPLVGMGLAFPAAWLIDRVSPYKLVLAYVALQAVLCIALFRVHDATGLIGVSFIHVVTYTLMSTANMIILRAMPPAEVGSITATAAFVNNAFNATLVFVSGQLIEGLGHNYHAAYVLGVGTTLGGLGLLGVYRYLMRKPATGLITATRPVANESARDGMRVENDVVIG